MPDYSLRLSDIAPYCASEQIGVIIPDSMFLLRMTVEDAVSLYGERELSQFGLEDDLITFVLS